MAGMFGGRNEGHDARRSWDVHAGRILAISPAICFSECNARKPQLLRRPWQRVEFARYTMAPGSR